MANDLIGVATTLTYLHVHLFDVDDEAAKYSTVIIRFHGPMPVYGVMESATILTAGTGCHYTNTGTVFQ
jgi:hypothetical protein